LVGQNFFLVIFSKVFIDLNGEQNKEKITLNIFKLVITSFHIKKIMKKKIFSSNLFENKDFFKIIKTNDDLNYLEKFVEKLFSKTHLDASESAINTYFVTSKLNILIKNFLLYRKLPVKGFIQIFS
jgi:hypothetical protein